MNAGLNCDLLFHRRIHSGVDLIATLRQIRPRAIVIFLYYLFRWFSDLHEYAAHAAQGDTTPARIALNLSCQVTLR